MSKKKVSADIQFEYKHRRYVSFQPLDPKIESIKSRIERRRYLRGIYKKGYYVPSYPPWTARKVVDADIKDLREEDIVLNGLYQGRITIELAKVIDDSTIKVGSRASRMINPLQWQYRTEKRWRAKVEGGDVWGGMPTGIFSVNMQVEMPKDNYDTIIRCSKSFTNLTAYELADKRLSDFRDQLQEIKDMQHPELEEFTRRKAEYSRVASIVKLSKHTLEKSELNLIPPLEKILAKKNGPFYKGIHSFITDSIEENPQAEWAKEMLSIRQQMIEDKELGRKERDYKLKGKARKTLKLIEEADDIAEDIFKIFRFYMNIHLASVKYQLDQYWIDLMPEWEMDNFYRNNRVVMDGHHILAVPVYSVGALWIQKKGKGDNIHKREWELAADKPIAKAVALSYGFMSEGLLTRAYEALISGDCEICVALSSSAIEREFAGIYLRKEFDKLESKVELPNRSNKFKKTLDRWEPIFKKHCNSVGLTKVDVYNLFQHQHYLRELRNKALHYGVTVKTHIERAGQGRKDYSTPEHYEVKIPRIIDHKKPHPYHWRVVDYLHNSCWQIREALIKFRNRFLYSEE